MMEYKELVRIAIAARENAYAPYSHFKVGAALLAKDGRVFTGCNIECASYSPSNCAERTALFKAVSEGVREFSALAVLGWKEGEKCTGFAAPCGVCRQMLYEFCGTDMPVIMAKNEDELKVMTLGELLPEGFGPANLLG